MGLLKDGLPHGNTREWSRCIPHASIWVWPVRDHLQQGFGKVVDGHHGIACEGRQSVLVRLRTHPTASKESIHALATLEVVELPTAQWVVVVRSACIDRAIVGGEKKNNRVLVLALLLHGRNEVPDNPVDTWVVL